MILYDIVPDELRNVPGITILCGRGLHLRVARMHDPDLEPEMLVFLYPERDLHPREHAAIAESFVRFAADI